MGYSPWGRKESDTTERLHFHFPYYESEATSSPLQADSLAAGAGLRHERIYKIETDT